MPRGTTRAELTTYAVVLLLWSPYPALGLEEPEWGIAHLCPSGRLQQRRIWMWRGHVAGPDDAPCGGTVLQDAAKANAPDLDSPAVPLVFFFLSGYYSRPVAVYREVVI